MSETKLKPCGSHTLKRINVDKFECFVCGKIITVNPLEMSKEKYKKFLEGVKA